MFWKKTGLLVLALFLLVTSARATQPIRGFVIDGTNGEPLPVANVMIQGSSRGSATNLDGFFLIPALNPGEYTLTVTYLGYHARDLSVTVTNKLMEPMNIELLPKSIQLEEVIYTVEESEAAKRESPRVSVVPVDQNTIRMVPTLGAELDVLRVIQSIPGVKTTSDLSSAPYVRGGSSDMTLILMDQSTVYNPSHMFGIFSTFNGDAVKRLDLMKGGFPAEYGGRAGSVLEVITNDGNRRKTEGLVSVGLVSARAALEGPINNHGSYAISGRRTYLEPVLDAVRTVMNTDLPNYFFYDANGKVNFDLTNKTTLTVGGYTGRDVLDFEFGEDDARVYAGVHWGNKTSTARLRQVLGRSAFLTVGGAYSQFESGAEFVDRGEEGRPDVTFQEFINHFDDTNMRADFEYLGVPNHRMKTGLMFSNYTVDVLNRSEDTYYMDVKASSYNLSVYIQDQWKLNPMLEIMPGIRVYRHELIDGLIVDPRFSLVYHYSPEIRFKMAGGKYSQFVNVMSAGDALSFFDVWVPQDGSLNPTNSDQVVLGWEWDFKEYHEFTFETYYNRLNHVFTSDQTIDEGHQASDAFLDGEGRAWGFEWLLRKKNGGRFTGWIGYSLSWSKRRFPGTYLNNGDWFYPKWDRRHDVILVGMYRINKRWDVSGQWRYNTGQGYTQGIGIYTIRFDGIPDNALSSDGRKIIYGGQNNYRFPADHRLDLNASWHHHLFGAPATLTMTVYNAYNRRAIFTRSYDTMENPVTYEDVKLLPILPLVSYEVRF
ncbi:MAG: TonB-dependent receptor [bacterium]